MFQGDLVRSFTFSTLIDGKRERERDIIVLSLSLTERLAWCFTTSADGRGDVDERNLISKRLHDGIKQKSH